MTKNKFIHPSDQIVAFMKRIYDYGMTTTSGGNLSIIGAPGNLIGTNALNELGIETGFFEYIGVGLPMLVFGILYFAVFGYKLLPDNKNLVSADDDQFAAKDFSGVPVWKQTASLVILILSILAMIFE